jgi:hypothetical protein
MGEGCKRIEGQWPNEHNGGLCTHNNKPSPSPSPPRSPIEDPSLEEIQKSPQWTSAENHEHDYNPEAIPPSFQTPSLTSDHSRQKPPQKKQIFQNLCIFINGTTGPLISDHKLKYLLAEHGARMSIALGRRSVTHVILGNTYNKGGAGGGLAGTKIQKEISRVGGKGIKFVSVEW